MASRRTSSSAGSTNKKVVPYYSREEIDQKKILAGRDLEILWCSDIVDIYLLQVQGSGKVDLGDGNIVSVLYDGANGRPYKSIGKYLIDTGAMTKENMSMQAIREYLRTHPDKLADVLNQNPSYVFFRLDTGPSLGNIGVPLTPGRSIATDSKLVPQGRAGLHRSAETGDRERRDQGMGALYALRAEPGHGRRDQGAGQGGRVLRPGRRKRNSRRGTCSRRGSCIF